MAAKKKELSFQEILAKASKDYDLKMGPMTEGVEPVDSITTGNLAIDHIIGAGGLPYGRSAELFGAPSSGKTTTALQAAAALQQGIIETGIEDEAYIAYFDHEQALDPAYCEQLGLDLQHPSWLFTQPDSMQQATNMARTLIGTGKVRMVIFDSVASMTPEDMLTQESGKASVAVKARLMAEFMQQLNPLIRRHRCVAVFINHIRDVIDLNNPTGVKRTTTPGGSALKFYASLRLEYKQVGQVVKTGTDPLMAEEVRRVEATNVRVKVVKNKVAVPFREATVRVRFGKGFDNGFTAFQILVGRRKIPKGDGSRYFFDKVPELLTDDMPVRKTGTPRPYLHGEPAVIRKLDDDPGWRLKVIQMAEEVVATEGVALPDEAEAELPDLQTLAE